MGKSKRKLKPSMPKWWWLDTDGCWWCKNRNNCGSCKAARKYMKKHGKKKVKGNHDLTV